MSMTLKIGKWMALLRANFLVLTLVTVAAGFAAAFYDRHVFNAATGFLALIGATLTHVAVNVFNNYFDFRSGIDEKTSKTPFSGGIEVLVKGEIKPSTAFFLAFSCLIGAGIIGVYFLTLFFWPLLPVLIYGAISIYFYTPYLSHIPGVGEIIAGTNFGLMSVGAYITQVGFVTPTALAVFVPVSLLVYLLLFLNEFPDVEVDRRAGRRHLVILLGRRHAARLYSLLLVVTYLSIATFVFVGLMPMTSLLALATCPLAYRAASVALRNCEDPNALVPALASNVLVVLFTIGLTAAGHLIGSLL